MRYSAEGFFVQIYVLRIVYYISVVQAEAKLFPSCLEFLRETLISHLTCVLDDPFNTNEIMLCLAIYPCILFQTVCVHV